MEILRARNIVKKFAGQTTLRQVTVSVPEGSVYGLLGPNGAGKTTLIRIINRIIAQDEGELFFENRKMTSGDVMKIGYLPEERGLYKKMRVGEQALYLAQLKGLSKNLAVSRLREWFGKFEILPWWDKKVEELSRGMQQKIQFITTVLHEPRLLIFDEPFSGFDPINVNLLKNEILQLKESGTTIIFSTHNMGSVEELCDHITLIHKAETLLEGPIDLIRQNYKANVYEVGFNGDPGVLKSALNSHYELKDLQPAGEGHLALVKLLHGDSDNELLRRLIPGVEITSFREKLPSMNDIFIQAVHNGNQNE